MLKRTVREAMDAMDANIFIGLGEEVIFEHDVNGNKYYSVQKFANYHKCKACRNASIKGRLIKNVKLASTGHTCNICGNPYAGFVRRGVRRINKNKYEVINSWTNSGRLH